MIRLFVALVIPEEIKNQIIEIRNNILPSPKKFSWEDNSKLHLTLKFIGEVNENLLELIMSGLNFLEDFHKINCTTDRFGFFFKSKDEPRILWLGLTIDRSIYFIVDELNQKLSDYSVPIEKRKFKAHLTLLRIKNSVSKDFVEKFSNAEFPKINFVSSEIVLMKSNLSSKGSTYTEIKKYYLK